MFVSAEYQTLKQMRAMTCEDILAFDEAAEERDERVHDDDPHQERADQQRVATRIGRDQ